MKLSTRLLLPLLATVAGVMLLYAWWALDQRQETLAAEARRETQAYATALGFALEGALRDPEMRDVQAIIDGISREATIYGVLVYGRDGASLFRSNPVSAATPAPEAVMNEVLGSGRTALFEREIDDQRVFSVVRALRDEAGAVVGAFEVAQPLAFLEAESARTRQRFLLNTVTLLAAVTVVIVLLVRRLVAAPLHRLVAAARALGRGELGYRLGSARPAGGELAALAAEFDRMADHLQAARAELVEKAEERLALERRLRRTEKLAAVGELSARLAHEIAAPLHVIQGRAGMLLRKAPPEAPERRNLRIIADQISRITAIVRNLLEFSRRREPRTVDLDLVEVVRGVVELFEDELERAGVRVRHEGPERVPARGDPDLLHQVFVNLFTNALQAMTEHPGESLLRIRFLVDTAPGDKDRPGLAPGWVGVEVVDSGPGLPPGGPERVFEPFFTTKAGGEGTGLGLAVARSIAEEHGGSLDARSETGAGAVFRLTLPETVPAELEGSRG